MDPEWEFLLDTVVRWLPYIAVILFIPMAVLLVRCLTKGACRNGPIVKTASYNDEEFWIGDLAALKTRKEFMQENGKHKSLPNLQDNNSDIFRSVSLTREESGTVSRQEEKEGSNTEHGICSMCSAVYTEINVSKNLPCTHHFHQKCADEWFSKRTYCPQCIRPSSASIIKR
jgi:hypothetical protein